MYVSSADVSLKRRLNVNVNVRDADCSINVRLIDLVMFMISDPIRLLLDIIIIIMKLTQTEQQR